MTSDERASEAAAGDHPRGRIVIVGAVTRDVFDDREAPGGAVSFAARVGAAFGYRASILTIGAPEDALLSVRGESPSGSVRAEPVEGRSPSGRGSTGSPRTEGTSSGRAEEPGPADTPFTHHEVHWVESSRTLTYRHRFVDGERELTVLERPDRALSYDDLPEAWTDAEMLVLAPLLPDDIDIRSFRELPRVRERALLAQGLMREAAPGEPVRTASGFPDRLFAASSPDASIFLSHDEVEGWPRAAMEAIWSTCRRIVVTRGARGAEVRSGLRRFHVQPAPNAGPVVDVTGAGDVFATAFILALAEGEDEERAAQLASVYAAVNIEQQGAAPLPPLDEVRRRLEAARGAASTVSASQPGRPSA